MLILNGKTTCNNLRILSRNQFSFIQMITNNQCIDAKINIAIVNLYSCSVINTMIFNYISFAIIIFIAQTNQSTSIFNTAE